MPVTLIARVWPRLPGRGRAGSVAQPLHPASPRAAQRRPGGSETGATSTYVRASLPEVAAALAALTGEPHPLATSEGW